MSILRFREISILGGDGVSLHSSYTPLPVSSPLTSTEVPTPSVFGMLLIGGGYERFLVGGSKIKAAE